MTAISKDVTQSLSDASKLKSLIDLGIALSAERDHNRLMERILIEAQAITHADGGTLYLREGNRLAFAIMRNDSLNITLGGTTGQIIPFPPLWLYDEDSGTPNENNVATYCAVHNEAVNIVDAYDSDRFDFSGTKAFDANTGYRSKSFLTIPLINRANHVIAVLQLINANDPDTSETISFSDDVQPMVEALASQAAVALDNQLLFQAQRELLESFIKLMAEAIDEKSPYTGGHCQRVPVLTEMLVDAARESNEPNFADFDLNEEQRYEVHIAGWMHDCGKVTTPEHVMDKSTKLETIYDRIETVRTRFEVLKRDARISYLEAIVEDGADKSALRAQLEAELTELEADCAFLEAANIGGEMMADDDIARIERIANRRWRDVAGQERDLLSEEEVYNLSIRRGTLTTEERNVINNHMAVTIKMLEQLPFPRNLERVPEIAGGHHEKMDGTGYPKGLTRDQMSLPARAMAIADIYEALTAADRPYKKAQTLSETLRIMGSMKRTHHVDPELFDLFLTSGVYLKYADLFLSPEQIDDVDVTQYLGPVPPPESAAQRNRA
ncbi:MAG: GAF domain-containing protein [Proteobacteria bacterium]|nr:GAF domain-containing protein [Pseudomonadota bacterium]